MNIMNVLSINKQNRVTKICFVLSTLFLGAIYAMPSIAATGNTDIKMQSTIATKASANSKVSIDEKDLYGVWHCQHDTVEPRTKMKININYNINFAENGKSKGFGTLLFYIPNMPVIKYKATDSSSWSIKNDQLIMSSDEIKFVNVSHPQLDQFLNLKTILPQTINESGQIVELSKSTLKVKSNSYADIHSCSKALIKK
ncbi:hypothetical protein N8878_06905 [Psychromonas sp.]|nr:hypothetical protein [Psychromonas sp.]